LSGTRKIRRGKGGDITHEEFLRKLGDGRGKHYGRGILSLAEAGKSTPEKNIVKTGLYMQVEVTGD